MDRSSRQSAAVESARRMTRSFNEIDIAVSVLSLLTFIVDVSTDVAVCVQLLLANHLVWGLLMTSFISVPSVVMNVFSLIWHVHDKSVTKAVVISHLLLLAPMQRYLTVIYLGFKSRLSRKVVLTQRALRAQSDVSILRLFESFLEAAPQLVLQLYIMVLTGFNWFTTVSACCSLLSLTWAMTAYTDSQRRAHRDVYQRRIVRLILHWGWQLFMTSSRIAAFVAFAAVLNNWVFVIMGAHWILAFVWITVRGTDFGESVCEKWLFRAVCAFIYIFVFLNLNDGTSRWRITAYYALVLAENAAMVSVFLVLGDGTEFLTATSATVFAGFFIGLLFMMVYYGFLHPSGSANHLKKFLKSRPSDEQATGSAVSVEEPQIFSIISPAPIPGMESTIDLSLDPAHSHRSRSKSGQSVHPTGHSSNQAMLVKTVNTMSPRALREAWQSGMQSLSSSSSSSSLAGDEEMEVNTSGLTRRQSSSSKGSENSATSENHLLPSTSNDLSRSPKKLDKTLTKDVLSLRKDEEASGSDNLDYNLSHSPALSRGSWGRSSDNNQYSTAVEEFTVLGFDDLSSLDHQRSDSSSFSSFPKSMSPLNISGLLHDVNGRLRATIAATIAAATNSSSTEGTPNKLKQLSRRHRASYSSKESSFSRRSSVSSQEPSLSQRSSLSNQDDSWNLIDEKPELNPNNAFVDSTSSHKDGRCSGGTEGGKSDLSRHTRESLSSLPDILESLEQGSDPGTADSSYEKSAREGMVQMEAAAELSPLQELKPETRQILGVPDAQMNSPLPQDSTLTVSKLDSKGRSRSYLTAQHLRSDVACREDILDTRLDPNLVNSAFSSPSRVSDKPSSHNGDSPFSDRELVAVMTKSLRSYIGGSSESHNAEREGLALTLDDLCLEDDLTPNDSFSGSRGVGEIVRTRSASSLFHDSEESSPASSASKMNRLAMAVAAESKLSPNAFKQMGSSPQALDRVKANIARLCGSETGTVSDSFALKFIIDSYGQDVANSPILGTPTSKSRMLVKNPQLRTTPKLKVHSNSIAPRAEHSPQRVISPLAGPSDISTSSMWNRSPLTASDLEPVQPTARAGKSSTKRLPTLTSRDLSMLQYSTSPYRNGEKESYVSAQYHPPLCADVEDSDGSEKDSIERNMDIQFTKSPYGRSKKEDFVMEVSSTTDHHKPMGSKIRDIDRNADLRSLNRGLTERERYQQQRGDFFQLHQNAQTSSHLLPNKVSIHSPHSRHSYAAPNSYWQPSQPDLRRPRSLSHNQEPDLYYMEELAEDEFNVSPEHIASYFNDATAFNSSQSYSNRHSKKPQSHLQIHGKRNPLQQVNSTARLSPEVTVNFNVSSKDKQYKKRISNTDLLDGNNQRVEETMRYERFSKSDMDHVSMKDRDGVHQRRDRQRKVTSRPPSYRTQEPSPQKSRSSSKPEVKRVQFI